MKEIDHPSGRWIEQPDGGWLPAGAMGDRGFEPSDSGWVPVAYASGAADFGSGYAGCQTRLIDGVVYLRGLVGFSGAGIAINTTIFTVTPLHRPGSSLILSGRGEVSGPTKSGREFRLTSAGLFTDATSANNTGGWISVSGISWHAS